MNFSEDELAELSPFDAVAFDRARVTAAAQGETIPCWLVTSKAAKGVVRERARAWLANHGITEGWVNRHFDGGVEQWHRAEWDAKVRRESSPPDPRAFFAVAD